MKARLGALLLAGAITAACTAGDISGPGLEPIPGSITYTGQPRTKLTKSPIGSAFPHTFYSGSRIVDETYIIRPDRSLMISNRRYRSIVRMDHQDRR